MTPTPTGRDTSTSPTNGTLAADEFAFVAEVGVRWSDMDAFGHINHARMVTLMEEARIEWLRSARESGGPANADDHPDEPNSAADYAQLIMSAMIVHVEIRYQRQLRHEDTPLRIGMWIKGFRSVDFTIGYEIRGADDDSSTKPACVASTQMAVVDVEAHSLRRLTAVEKEFLRSWSR
ncbi:thioesterase family protein [Gordonia sp. CPCC 206044]|uniref:acyl-CoA thioesterase n=1 Tax=Gordonia sp. CPCC 206044 TaxID=3140793 RepID=UPI003AF3C757